MVFLSVKNMSKVYPQSEKDVVALKAISFDLREGESLAVVGGSGAGKSTLLNLLGGLDTPSSGEIVIEGKNLNAMNDAEKSEFRNRTLGFVFQFHHLLKDFSVLENVMMPLKIRGLSDTEIQDEAFDLLQKVGLADKGSRLPHELSGGEQQRVALVRAMIHKPKLILADEPTGNLDDKNASTVFELLCDLNRDLKAALIVVTHNLELAKRLQNQIVLKDGHKI